MTIDLSKIPEVLQSVLVSIVLIPFWIISIYIFNKDLYNTNDYLIITCLCISLTIVSNIFMLFIGFIPKIHKDIFHLNLSVKSAVYQSIILSILICVCHYLKTRKNINIEFTMFLYIYFIPLFILFLVNIVILRLSKK